MLASEVMADSALLLADSAQVQWTNAILLPYLKMAWGSLELKLFAAGTRQLKKVPALINVPALTISFSTANLLPTDFVQPVTLEDSDLVSTNPDISSNYFRTVREVDNIKVYSDYLDYINEYCFREQDIKINPSSIARLVRLTYMATLTPITSSSSTIALFLSKPYLAAKTAAFAAAFNGTNTERGMALEAIAEGYLEDLLITENRNRQAVTYRRKRMGFWNRRIY